MPGNSTIVIVMNIVPRAEASLMYNNREQCAIYCLLRNVMASINQLKHILNIIQYIIKT